MEFDELSNRVIGYAIEVHRELGPGLLESTYEQCLAHELSRDNISFKLQHPLPVIYKSVRIDCGYRVDLLVEDKLILELKSVEQLNKIHAAQLLTYMKLARIKTGLLINFNTQMLKHSIKRFVL
ncbi:MULTISPECIES: GxxExxY protein [Desulfobacter]|jgi:GxxExxY protein|uniref:GxxExxY protein n=1 Tax=Desulfobacter TaxID=2289 RepID=UPI000E8CFB5D|nr:MULTISPECIES: GxxExxY protein [Desulfobacter]MDX9962515.1 GxxExxY protein [Desulfobacter postgatei]HBT87673.1 GxxExxY protein [Desulfobacter sp.]